jgi:hypothetical protein
MIIANSLSGGKTSSYIAANYPADLNVFALCCIDDPNANAHYRKRYKDEKMIQRVNDKLQKYCSNYPEFVATSEDPQILWTMFDLEQMIGSEIIWVRGMGWEQMLQYKKAIPNMSKRFCTTIMKMQAIFDLLLMYFELPVQMRIGYRYDELERAERFSESWKYSTHCEYRPKSNTWIHRWSEIVWRVGEFPLVEDKILHYHIQQFWKDKNIKFPIDSNCLNCFWKQPQQLRKNFDEHAPIMYWAAIQEELMNRTFKDDNSLLEISKMGIQLDFLFGTGSGCQSGFCTN